MNYNKIKELYKLNTNPKSDFFEKVDITRSGFLKALENMTLRVDTLELIAKYFQKPVSFFFDEHTGPEMSKKIALPTIDELQVKVHELYEENKKLSDENRVLMKDNIALKEKIHTLEKNNTLSDDAHVPKLKEKK